jgi:hypothetical protein
MHPGVRLAVWLPKSSCKTKGSLRPRAVLYWERNGFCL